MNWLKDYSGLTIWLTNRPTLADLTIRLAIRLTTRLTVWQFSLQFGLQFCFSIRLYHSAYDFDLQFGWPKRVKRSERPSSDSAVVQSGCLVSMPSMADVSRIGRSNGKGNPWQGQFLVARFLVDRFPIMDLSSIPGAHPGHIEHWTETVSLVFWV